MLVRIVIYMLISSLFVFCLSCTGWNGDVELISIGNSSSSYAKKQYEVLPLKNNRPPPIKIFVIVDNSFSMYDEHQKLGKSFKSLFSKIEKETLNKSEISIYLINTAQHNFNISLAPDFAILDEAFIKSQKYNLGNFESDRYLSDGINLTGKIAGDIFGFTLRSEISSGNKDNMQISKKIFAVAPVLSSNYINQQIQGVSEAIVLKGGEHNENDWNTLSDQFAEKLKILNPALSKGHMYSKRICDLNNSCKEVRYGEFDEVLDNESAMCAMARVIKTSSSTLILPGDLVAFIVLSDEDDSDPLGENCLGAETIKEKSDIAFLNAVCEKDVPSISARLNYKMAEVPTRCEVSYQSGYIAKLEVRQSAVQVDYFQKEMPARYIQYQKKIAINEDEQHFNTSISYRYRLNTANCESHDGIIICPEQNITTAIRELDNLVDVCSNQDGARRADGSIIPNCLRPEVCNSVVKSLNLNPQPLVRNGYSVQCNVSSFKLPSNQTTFILSPWEGYVTESEFNPGGSSDFEVLCRNYIVDHGGDINKAYSCDREAHPETLLMHTPLTYAVPADCNANPLNFIKIKFPGIDLDSVISNLDHGPRCLVQVVLDTDKASQQIIYPLVNGGDARVLDLDIYEGRYATNRFGKIADSKFSFMQSLVDKLVNDSHLDSSFEIKNLVIESLGQQKLSRNLVAGEKCDSAMILKVLNSEPNCAVAGKCLFAKGQEFAGTPEYTVTKNFNLFGIGVQDVNLQLSCNNEVYGLEKLNCGKDFYFNESIEARVNQIKGVKLGTTTISDIQSALVHRKNEYKKLSAIKENYYKNLYCNNGVWTTKKYNEKIIERDFLNGIAESESDSGIIRNLNYRNLSDEIAEESLKYTGIYPLLTMFVSNPELAKVNYKYYYKLSSKLNGQFADLDSDDYGIAFSNISIRINDQLNRSITLKKMSSHQAVLRIWLLDEIGNIAKEILPIDNSTNSFNWVQSGRTIIFSKNLKDLDFRQFKIEYF